MTYLRLTFFALILGGLPLLWAAVQGGTGPRAALVIGSAAFAAGAGRTHETG